MPMLARNDRASTARTARMARARCIPPEVGGASSRLEMGNSVPDGGSATANWQRLDECRSLGPRPALKELGPPTDESQVRVPRGLTARRLANPDPIPSHLHRRKTNAAEAPRADSQRGEGLYAHRAPRRHPHVRDLVVVLPAVFLSLTRQGA